MKKLIITLIISSFSFMQSQAQVSIATLQKMPVEQKVRLITDSLKATLSLSNDQSIKTQSLLQEAMTKAMPVMKSDDLKFSKGMQLKDIFTDFEKKMKPVLSAQQYALYEVKKKATIAYYRKQIQEQNIVFNPAK